RAMIAVDRFATHALYWSVGDGRLAFSTRPLDVPGLLDRVPDIDPRALHAYLYFHVIPAPLSICGGVRRLDIGEAVVVEPGSSPRLVRYWRPTFQPVRRFHFAEQQERFLAALRQGVRE